MQAKQKIFDDCLDIVKDCFQYLLGCPVHKPATLLNNLQLLTDSGVYIFSETSGSQEKFLYVGQSNNIANRLKEHCAQPNWKKANFALKMTLEIPGNRPIPGSPNATIESMFTLQKFCQDFDNTVTRIKAMNYRWLPVPDKLTKNLLEIYSSVVLKSQYNEFD